MGKYDKYKGFVPDGYKYCYYCKQVKPKIDFGKNRTHKDGLSTACRKCKGLIKHGDKHYNIQLSSMKIPLLEFCELCPEDDRSKAVERHHPDYDYPDIVVSVCKKCHAILDKDRRDNNLIDVQVIVE